MAGPNAWPKASAMALGRFIGTAVAGRSQQRRMPSALPAAHGIRPTPQGAPCHGLAAPAHHL